MAIKDASEHSILNSERDSFDAVREVASLFLSREISPEGLRNISRVSEGFSGGAVYRCSTTVGEFAVKRWPLPSKPERIAEVHAVQRFAAESLAMIPPLMTDAFGKTSIVVRNAYYECSRWMPGQAANDEDADNISWAENIRRGAVAIADFHHRTADRGVQTDIAPSVTQRLTRLAELQTCLPDAIARRGQLTGSIRIAAEYLARNSHTLHRDAVVALQPWSRRPVELQWVLRDVHREHVLFASGEVTGIVDFDALKRDTIALDLARWVGSFTYRATGPRPWDVAMVGYESRRRILPCERELAGELGQANRFINLANWVVWVAGESRQFPGGIAAVNKRVADLLRKVDVRI